MGQLPPVCTALTRWGVPCSLLSDLDPFVHVERDYLRHLFVHAGLAPLLWVGLRLAVVHLWVPRASTLWPTPREASFDGIKELPEATATALPADEQLRQAAQAGTYEKAEQMSSYTPAAATTTRPGNQSGGL